MAKSKLNDVQRGQVLAWLAEGLTGGEINTLSASFDPPFKVSNQLLYQYRKDHDIDLRKLRNDRDEEMITTGLSLRANRIRGLMELARMLEEDLKVKELVWLEQVKGIGSGDNYERVSYEEFNAAEIKELRGIYDDIAKETGGRITRTDITSNNKQIKGYVMISPDDWPDKE